MTRLGRYKDFEIFDNVRQIIFDNNDIFLDNSLLENQRSISESLETFVSLSFSTEGYRIGSGCSTKEQNLLHKHYAETPRSGILGWSVSTVQNKDVNPKLDRR
jgi:hypothetical protein